MALDPITAVLNAASTVIDKIFPDANQAATAKAKLIELQLSGELQATLGQIEINKNEATNPSLFVSGWRPFIGWSCGIGFVYATLGQPLFTWIGLNAGFVPPPIPDTAVLTTTLFGMLGLGSLRTYEKTQGVERNN